MRCTYVTLLVCCVHAAIFSPAALAQVYSLQGQITAGTSLFPPEEPDFTIPWEEYGAPSTGFPIDYAAALTLGPDGEWTFRFRAADQDREISVPIGVSVSQENASSSVLATETAIEISFAGGRSFVEQFDLSIDLDEGTGTWNWDQFCPVCDLAFPLPSAQATVTSVQQIPEPTTFVLAVGSVCFLWRTKKSVVG